MLSVHWLHAGHIVSAKGIYVKSKQRPVLRELTVQKEGAF